MTSEHAAVFREYVVLTDRKTRVRLSLNDDAVRSRFGTDRLGKVEGNHLMFTIGDTTHGRATDLTRRIGLLLLQHGVQTHTVLTTSGQKNRVYLAVDLGTCTADLLREALTQVIGLVRET